MDKGKKRVTGKKKHKCSIEKEILPREVPQDGLVNYSKDSILIALLIINMSFKTQD